jgi:phosphohistidine phosphatase SixA
MVTSRSAVFCVILEGLFSCTPVPGNLLRKGRELWKGIHYEIFCDDLPAAQGPPAPLSEPPRVRRVQVVFVRHGQSVWNTVTNSSSWKWLRNIAAATAKEIQSMWSREVDSALFDAPLTDEGVWEAEALAESIRRQTVPPLLAAALHPSAAPRRVILVSNLRRAQETAYLTLPHLLAAEPLVMDSTLQESCCKIDAQSMHETAGPLVGGVLLRRSQTAQHPVSSNEHRVLRHERSEAFNGGNKQIGTKNNVWTRTARFVDRLFALAHFTESDRSAFLDGTVSEPPLFIVVGHSSWLRRFISRYTPSGEPSNTLLHEAGRKKLSNCGVVVFDLVLQDGNAPPGTATVSIDPDSFSIAYGSLH